MFSDREESSGAPSIRGRRFHKLFEQTVDRLLGERIRADGALAIDMWSALANVDWRGPNDAVVRYSFRAAGDMVAWIREDGSYMDWYCSGPIGVVSPWISEALAVEGWSWVAADVATQTVSILGSK